MCRIERFTIVHPNGRREPGNRLRYCERGTPTTPCNHSILVDIEDQLVPGPAAHFSPPPPPPPPPPQFDVEPRQRGTSKRKEFSDKIRLVFNFHIPFTSRKTNPKPPKRESVFVRRRQPHQEPERPRHHHQPHNIPQAPPVIQVPYGHPQGPPVIQVPYVPPQGPPVVQVPFRHPAEHVPHHPREPEIMHPRRQQPIPIPDLLHWDERHAPPAIAPAREHHRHARQRSYDENKRLQRDRERQARIDSIERERRRRNLEEERERERERDRERARDRERQRAAQEQRRIEQNRLEREQRIAEERERIARSQRLRIPRQPRHATAVHHDLGGRGSFQEQGNRVINDAIYAENQRQAERNWLPTGWERRRDPGNGRRVRDRVAIGERRIDENDRTRFGRRWL